MPSRLQERQETLQERIEKDRRVADIKVERRQLEPKVQLRVIIERTGVITFQPLLDGPLHQVAPGQEIKMQFKGERIIQSQNEIVKRFTMNEPEAEGDELPLLTPEKIASAIGHLLPYFAQKAFR